MAAMYLSQHQPKKHLCDQRAAGFHRNLTLEGQADFPRRCGGSAVLLGLGKRFRQVKRYRCTCLGSEQHCCEFLALVRDQKLCRHKTLKRYQCYAVPDTKCSKDGGENTGNKPLTLASGSVLFLDLSVHTWELRRFPAIFLLSLRTLFLIFGFPLLWGSEELALFLNSANSCSSLSRLQSDLLYYKQAFPALMPDWPPTTPVLL